MTRPTVKTTQSLAVNSTAPLAHERGVAIGLTDDCYNLDHTRNYDSIRLLPAGPETRTADRDLVAEARADRLERCTAYKAADATRLSACRKATQERADWEEREIYKTMEFMSDRRSIGEM